MPPNLLFGMADRAAAHLLLAMPLVSSLLIGAILAASWYGHLVRDGLHVPLLLPELLAIPLILTPALALLGAGYWFPGAFTLGACGMGATLGWVYGRRRGWCRPETPWRSVLGMATASAAWFVVSGGLLLVLVAFYENAGGVQIAG